MKLTAEDIDITNEEFKELVETPNELAFAQEVYEKDPYCFQVYDNLEEFGASDTDNELREGEDDWEWGKFLYNAYLNVGDFIFKFKSRRCLTGRA